MKYKFFILPLLMTCLSSQLQAQEVSKFTKADTLRGSNTSERSWWDVLHYKIDIIPNYTSRSINTTTTITFQVLKAGKKMQIDLQHPLQITSILSAKQSLPFVRDGNVYYVSFPSNLTKGTKHSIVIESKGNPVIAKRPPWDGGWIFEKDNLGRPWMSVACQGLGASVWYPCKDIQSDEPDNGAQINITVPDTLVAVANGRLKQKVKGQHNTITYQWAVTNPINNYNIIPYIGKYVSWHETYQGEKGKLDCSYWVLDYELTKAKEQFKQVPLMLKSFEKWLGPYPFYEDGYQLIQSPHLGMEHQSAVAYGNKFQNGYLGRDLSGSGWGLNWDFIIIHESGHEWFGNNITSKDIADMWVHEGFTNYTETLFTESLNGRDAADAYNFGIRNGIKNDKPIIGPYGVNQEGSGDMYPKAANMIHSIRNATGDDVRFNKALRLMNKKFYHQTVTTNQVAQLLSTALHLPLTSIFKQYLTTTQIPRLEYYFSDNKDRVFYRWTNCIKGFDLPIRLKKNEKSLYILPVANQWKSTKLEKTNTWYVTPKDIEFYFYITASQLSPNEQPHIH